MLRALSRLYRRLAAFADVDRLRALRSKLELERRDASSQIADPLVDEQRSGLFLADG